MGHKSEIVEVKEMSDEQVAYRVRCCGEQATDSWHTAAVTVNHEQSLKEHIAAVEARHEAKLQWRKKNPGASTLAGKPEVRMIEAGK